MMTSSSSSSSSNGSGAGKGMQHELVPLEAGGVGRILQPVHDLGESSTLRCPICLSFATDPVLTSCGTLMCTTCLKQPSGEQLRGCPVCRVPLGTHLTPLRANVFASKVWGQTPIRCPVFADQGCDWTGPASNIQEHLEKTCLVRPVKCTGCAVVVPRSLFAAHAGECLRRLVPCPLGCPASVPFADRDWHVGEKCLNQKVECTTFPAPVPADYRGCGASVLRGMLKQHQEEDCARRPVACMYGCAHFAPHSRMDDHYRDEWKLHGEAFQKLRGQLSTTPSQKCGSTPLSEKRGMLPPLSGQFMLAGYRTKHEEAAKGMKTAWDGYKLLHAADETSFFAAVRNGDRIVVTGGEFDSWQFSPHTWVYHLAEEKWFRSADLPEPRCLHSMHVLGPNRNIYVVGGLVYPKDHDAPGSSTVAVYNNDIGMWARHPAQMVKGRYSHASCVANGRIYVFGGKSAWKKSTALYDTEMFDPVVQVWRALAPAPFAAHYHHAVPVGEDDIWVLGGRHHGGTTARSVYKYSISLDSWSLVEHVTLPFEDWCLLSMAVDFDATTKCLTIMVPVGTDLHIRRYWDGTWTQSAQLPIPPGARRLGMGSPVFLPGP